VTVTADEAEPESRYDDLLREIARASERMPAPAGSVLAPGSLFQGKLRVVRPLGEGGMGKVYEVEHELTKHRRALKVLHPGASADAVARFVREASAAARIGSPHVAETFDAGRLAGGEPYLLMELLEGETLEQRLRRRGPLDPGELATLIHQACEGVQAAHDAGIIHRDLKPENLFVEMRQGQPFVKILDFGISKFEEGKTGAPGITRLGSVMGTPYYMSPEQMLGTGPIDARADVYALGVVLFECACGERPFDALSIEHLAILIHGRKTAPLRQRRPSLPSTFCEIVERAMAAKPEHRFQSARALGDALAPMRTVTLRPLSSRGGVGLPPRATPGAEGRSGQSVRRARRSRGLLAMGAAAIAVACGSLWVAMRTPIAPAAVTPRSISSRSGAALSGAARIDVASPPVAPVGVRPLAAAPDGIDAPSLPSPVRPSARPAAPAPPSSVRSRAEQNGLVNDNPFQ